MIASIRRRVYGGGSAIPPASSYIQNGLVFQLDGWEKGNKVSQGIWTDLIGGIELVQNSGNVIFEDNSVRTTHYNYYLLASSDKLIFENPADITVEVCIAPKFSGVCFYNGNSTKDNIVVYVNLKGTTLQFLQREKGWAYVMDYNSVYTASANQDAGMVNGTVLDTLGASDYWGMSDCIGMGSRNFYGTWYAIRVYNRKLSTTEMMFNQKLDNQRFNLGLTI